MSVSIPVCPDCSSALQLGSGDGLDHWSCPQGHGLALTLSEAHGRVQDDELDVLWQSARSAPAANRPSPFAPHLPMVRVTLAYDEDEVPEGRHGDGPDLGTVDLDVDVDEQFIWFDVDELDALPHDLPDAPPTPEDLEREAAIRARFGADLEQALAGRDDDEISERIYHQVARRPGLHSALDRLGRAVTSY